MSEPLTKRSDVDALVAESTILHRDSVWEGIFRELKRVFRNRDITLQRMARDSETITLSLQCKPGDPATLAEKLITDGEVSVEPGSSGPDPGEHYQRVVIRGATYVAHWLPDTGEVIVHLSTKYTGGRSLLRQVISAVANS